VTSGAPRDPGVRLIVLYKAVKAVAEVALAAGLVVLVASGELATARQLAGGIRHDVASRWSLLVGRALALLTDRRIHFVELGLLLDGCWSGLEGFCLWRGYRWAPWFVVIATAAPLPLEAVEIGRRHSVGRIAVALLNVAIVVYLATRIRRRSRP
jgi:uncharacterized membrane protein (DUF2068 family)